MKKGINMKIGWFGYGGNQWLVEMYRDLINDMGHQLITCHEYPNAGWRYDKKNINDFIDSADIMLLPHRSTQPAKSVNKLAISWSRGKPCIVGERPAYLKFVENKKNALVYTDQDSLAEAILYLEDEENRKFIGNNGFLTAEKHLHPRNLIGEFIEKINLSNRKTCVHVVIPHYSPRLDYLTLAVRSVLESKGDFDIRVNIVSSCPEGEPEVDDRVSVYHQKERLSFSEAVNIGLKHAKEDVTHFLVFNDDAILSEHALNNMLKVMGDKEMILNPWSNCDKGWLHKDELLLGPDKNLHPNMEISQFDKREIKKLFNYSPKNYTNQEYSGCDFCPLYCTLFPRSVLEKTGFLNEEFSNGGEDADFSYRARKLGIESFWTREAFVFHFGGKTRKVAHENDPESHLKEDFKNNSLLSKRWKKNKKRIAIWTGPAWESWDMDSPYTTGIGGSETCAIRLAEHAASLGHSVTMYGDHENKEQNGVQLKHFSEYHPEQNYWDLFIASRNVAPIVDQLKAGKILVWVHDIFILGIKEIPREIDSLVDRYIALSPWHADFLSNYHSMDKGRIVIIPNGVDSGLFE